MAEQTYNSIPATRKTNLSPQVKSVPLAQAIQNPELINTTPTNVSPLPYTPRTLENPNGGN